MAKISGKFAPLTDELGNDERFIMQSTDLDKLIYVLIIYTCHMTNHQAPKDPRFYKIRYGLRSKTGQIAESIGRLAALYPKISWGDKKLSLLNSPTYEIKNRLEIEEEGEKEGDVKVKNARPNVFKKPTLEELKELFGGKGFPAEAEKFFGHYEANGWRVGRNPMRSVQAAAANWIRNMGTYGKAESKPFVKKEAKPKPGCEACGGTGKLPDGPKCWCW